MTKTAPWVELLDSLLRRILRQNVLVIESQIVAKTMRIRWSRIEHMQLLLSLTMDFVEKDPRKGKMILSGGELQELTWAWKQFTTFDYELIKLCYGELSQHIYLLRYSRPMAKELNDYLVNGNGEALDRLFSIACGIALSEEHENNSELSNILKSYCELVDSAWAYWLIARS